MRGECRVHLTVINELLGSGKELSPIIFGISEHMCWTKCYFYYFKHCNFTFLDIFNQRVLGQAMSEFALEMQIRGHLGGPVGEVFAFWLVAMIPGSWVGAPRWAVGATGKIHLYQGKFRNIQGTCEITDSISNPIII